jgi:hypothetical protein
VDEVAAVDAAPVAVPEPLPPLPLPPLPLPRRPVAEPEPVAARESIVNGAPTATRAGLTRRVPGTHMAEAFQQQELDEPTVPIIRDPEAERDAVNDFLAGLARGEDTDGVHTSIHPAAERHT